MHPPSPTYKTMECDVCGGDGRYPIYDQQGDQRFSIECPECYGLGIIDDETEAARDNPSVTQEVR